MHRILNVKTRIAGRIPPVARGILFLLFCAAMGGALGYLYPILDSILDPINDPVLAAEVKIFSGHDYAIKGTFIGAVVGCLGCFAHYIHYVWAPGQIRVAEAGPGEPIPVPDDGKIWPPPIRRPPVADRPRQNSWHFATIYTLLLLLQFFAFVLWVLLQRASRGVWGPPRHDIGGLASAILELGAVLGFGLVIRTAQRTSQAEFSTRLTVTLLLLNVPPGFLSFFLATFY